MNIATTRTTALVAALALAIVAAGSASAAPAAQHTITGSLIPVKLQTVVVSTPSMAFIRAVAIKPLVQPIAGGRCAVTGAVYSDDAAVADGPMPHVRTVLVGADGQRVPAETNYEGIYRAVVSAGAWRETRPHVGELPFGVHPSRPRVTCD